MHRVVVTLTAGVSLIASLGQFAVAADLPPRPPAAQIPYWTWSGFYIGANGGGLSFETNGNFPNHPNNLPFRWHTDRKTVGFAGLHGGFQGQWGSFVAGVEAGYDWILNSGFAQSPGLDGATAPCGYGTGAFCQARIRSIFTVGPRLGYAVNQFMLYGTGGYARYRLHTRGVGFPTPGATFESVTDSHSGWFAGGGAEMFVTRNIALGVEYKHLEFGPANNQPTDIPIDTQRVKTKVDAVFLRLNWLNNFQWL
jgi:outer membrane immunogenic protein